jgi:hypothetical protein
MNKGVALAIVSMSNLVSLATAVDATFEWERV